jgi:hypothetical protein
MYAIIRKNTYDPASSPRPAPRWQSSRRCTLRNPGYVGSIDVDTGQGQRIIVNLWHTEQHARAGMTVLVPQVQRLLGSLMAGPS